ncbi:MAG: transcription elongation factor [Bacteroidetes bacterium HGW-Bacteroidetes-23]|nr:MAG: transcription elongation factor [Bacteroidetes bacterium HGW-Bacteroidetes-23]PKP25804.1 MAG: transcription elongation factor [Bacteroidetes bacterium HGW-Bacteroidetes-2]
MKLNETIFANLKFQLMIKRQLFVKCMEMLNLQMEKYKKEIQTVKEALENESSKSEDDDGGKSEMLTEIEKYSKYLENTENLKNQLKRIDITQEHNVVTNGSLVETENNFFFITVALGKIDIGDSKNYYSISTDAPIYAHLKGKEAGDTFNFNNHNYKIIQVY